MQAARRTVTLFRTTRQTTHHARPPYSRPRHTTHHTLSQPRHFFAPPQNNPTPHPIRAPTSSNHIRHTATTITPTSSSPSPTPQLTTHPSIPRISPPPSPSSPSSQTPTSFSVGLASGTLGAMCGVGGAVFAIPALVRFASLPQRVAAGNALAAVTAVAIAGAASFHAAGAVDASVAMPLAAAAAACTPVGARFAAVVDGAVLRRGLGAFMLLLAPVLPMRAAMARGEGRGKGGGLGDDEESSEVSSRRRVTFLGAGAAVGVMSGLLGLSGGSLFTPLIAAACPEMPFSTVMGTSFAAMIVPTAVGALSYARMGMMAPAGLPALVVGAAVGAKVGAAVALTVPETVLQYGFAVVFAVMGLRTVRRPIVVGGGKVGGRGR